MKTALLALQALAAGVSSTLHGFETSALLPSIQARASCEHSATARGCWGNYNIETDYYTTFPDSGKTVEVWLSVEEATCNQDGYKRKCMTFNGTMPGPAIVADWGDNLVVHVTNNLPYNGTTVHWHGVRLLNSVLQDGVPGVTQCPIKPHESLTYRFKVTQYGSSWYHSHFSLQYTEGLFGPLIFNGPATANYDVDVGPILLQDWSHEPIFTAWADKTKWGQTHSLSNLLLNGTNTFDCGGVDDKNCVGGGKKFELVLEPGKTHRIRLINVALDSVFQFSIDNHQLKVISTDFVAVEPFETDSVILHSGQRYDVLVEANEASGNYWMRSSWLKMCQGAANDKPDDMTGIVRYDASSRSIPTTSTTAKAAKTCEDMPASSLMPRLKLDVGKLSGTTVEDLNMHLTREGYFQWTMNGTTLWLDPGQPTLKKVLGNDTIPVRYNMVQVDKSNNTADEWAVLVIENNGVLALQGVAHPIHLHGHDFWILEQVAHGKWDGTANGFSTKNPARRDVAVLPPVGYLAIAFQLDNPGAWLVHCHIAWHSSEGLAFEFLESPGSIKLAPEDIRTFDKTCEQWAAWSPKAPFEQGDSAI